MSACGDSKDDDDGDGDNNNNDYDDDNDNNDDDDNNIINNAKSSLYGSVLHQHCLHSAVSVYMSLCVCVCVCVCVCFKQFSIEQVTQKMLQLEAILLFPLASWCTSDRISVWSLECGPL